MSTSGVRSSRGDAYQSWVATRYVVEMISDASLKEIEIDSTSIDRSGEPILVDDVVVRYADHSLYVQAKKNQTDFRAWSVADLGEELAKAWLQWRREPGAQILFISRNDFGDVAKLAEHAATQSTAEAFEKSLSVEQKRIADRIRDYDRESSSQQVDPQIDRTARHFAPQPGVATPLLSSRRWLALPGSCGQPRDGNPAACCAIYDTERRTLTTLRVPYDHHRAAEKIVAAGLPEALANRLIQGA